MYLFVASYIEMFDNVSLRLGELRVNIIMMLIILLPFLVAFVLTTYRLICGSELFKTFQDHWKVILVINALLHDSTCSHTLRNRCYRQTTVTAIAVTK